VLFCVMCVIAVPLPPGTNPFAVKINNNNGNVTGASRFHFVKTSEPTATVVPILQYTDAEGLERIPFGVVSYRRVAGLHVSALKQMCIS
jgi:hypothetical protein